MRSELHSVFKNYFRSQLLTARGSMTQEKTAALFDMSVRAYAAIESGESCCGLFTFLIYLRRLCPDRDAFFDELFRQWEKAEHEGL